MKFIERLCNSSGNKKPMTFEAVIKRGFRTEDIIKYLDEGGDVNHKGQHGETFLHAVSSEDIAAISLLVSRGADINARGYKGWTPLHYAVGTDCDTPDRGGCRAAGLLTAKTLIDLGADESLLSDDGKTPRDIAADYGEVEASLYDSISQRHKA